MDINDAVSTVEAVIDQVAKSATAEFPNDDWVMQRSTLVILLIGFDRISTKLLDIQERLKSIDQSI